MSKKEFDPKHRGYKGYDQRDGILKKMGYSSYREYLSSPLWLSIKDRVLVANPVCRLCKRRLASVVHHNNYREDVLRGECDNFLFSVCHGCHYKVEFDEDGNKLEDYEAFKKFVKMTIKADKPRKGGKPWIGLSYKAKHLRRKRGRSY